MTLCIDAAFTQQDVDIITSKTQIVQALSSQITIARASRYGQKVLHTLCDLSDHRQQTHNRTCKYHRDYALMALTERDFL